MANGKKKDPLAGGKGGRSSSSEDMAKLYSAARGITGGVGGRSVSDQALAYLYRLARGVTGQGKMGGAKPKKTKNPAMKWSPKGGKGMKKGGKVRRKAKY
tara:strand:- start:525 stop:824 length:300 start_codon:yes stop_codon:yes gene_type:complete